MRFAGDEVGVRPEDEARVKVSVRVRVGARVRVNVRARKRGQEDTWDQMRCKV